MTTPTLQLLQRWHRGDERALAELIARDLPWLRTEAMRRMGSELRQRQEADDVVQQALVHVMQFGPRFEVADEDHYRAILLRIVENTIRKMLRDSRRQKRSAGREEPLPSGSVIALAATATRPSAAADRNEQRAWLHLALELLDTDDREIVLQRQWHGLPFAVIGERLEINEDAARRRFERAVARLAQTVGQLRRGELVQACAR
ncbi:MAG TPA: sigma-70 family RNA polymerase sigma factor [Planctomycetota bacterium]|nr:sigma-70 family RNA polymerase sigma factor [Planctomycetota bacterium]